MGTKKTIEYNLKIGAQIEEVTSKTKKVNEEFNKLNKTASLGAVEKEFSKIGRIMDSLADKANKPMRTASNFDSVADELQRASRESGELYDGIKKLQNLTTKQKISLISEEAERKKLEGIFKAKEEYERRTKQIDKEVDRKKPKKEARLNEAIGKRDGDRKAVIQKMQEREALKEQKKNLNWNESSSNRLKELKAQQAAFEEYSKKRAALQKKIDHAPTEEKTTKEGRVIHSKAHYAQEFVELENSLKKQADAWEQHVSNLEKYSKRKKELEDILNDTNRSDSDKSTAKQELDALVPVSSIKDLEETEQKAEEIADKINNVNKEINSLNSTYKASHEHVKKLTTEFNQLGEADKAAALSNFKDALTQLGIPAKSLNGSIESITNNLQQMINDGVVPVDQALKALEASIRGTDQNFDRMRDSVLENKDAYIQENEAAAKIDGIKQRIKAYVGLQGAADFTRKAIQNSIQTIKDLDEVMTEMATVTDLGVGDYWAQMPEYSQRASDLGVAIKDVYKSSTLFYQQGLKTNEVVGMSNETLKMARIAGLDAKDATDKMTAALRGFNMELNETSAQRVSDVYSELAAITASDTKEIASAMTKTASIASNAGMEFETTAAFLSQIIETTRESAETAGTAMKTVIARFQELKKDPAEIGEVDGEIVDANKIETALRSVGVQLRDTSGQFRDLDDVFLELSSKWDGLDTNTQRYIATIAAGSRQQSRFIAMMSDYGRTQDLVAAANNSAGASNKQFEKTLESMDAKLNNLKNAWNEFTLGIMNSELLKTGVDILTTFLNIINKVTAGFGQWTGMFSKAGMLIAVFKTGEVLVNKLFTSLNAKIENLGNTIGTSIANGVKAGLGQAEADIEATKAKVASQNGQSTGNGVQDSLIKRATGVGQMIQGHTKLSEAHTGLNDISYSNEINESLKQAPQLSFRKGGHVTSPSLGGALKIAKHGDKLSTGALSIKTWNSIEKQFNKKMTLMGKKPNEIAKAWDKASKKIQKNGKLTEVIDDLDNELGDAAKSSGKLGEEGSEALSKITVHAIDNQDALEKGDALVKQSVDGYKDMAQGITQAGVATSMLGLGIGAVGTYLSEAGLDTAGEAFTTLGNVVSTTGGIMSTFGMIMGALSPMYKACIAASTAAAAASSGEAGAYTAKGLAALFAAIGITTASMAALFMVAVIIAVVAVVLILVAAFNAIKEASPEAELRRNEQALADTQTAANAAAESFNNLKDSLESLDGQYDTLDKLVKGTDEWKEAVQQTNDQVLDLIDKYPELAQYAEMDQDGVLRLDTESKEVKNILAQEEGKALAAKNSTLMAKMKVNQAQKEVDYDNLSWDAQYGSQGGQLAGEIAAWTAGLLIPGQIGLGFDVSAANRKQEEVDQEITEQVAMALAEGKIGEAEGQMSMSEFLDSKGADSSFADELELASDELREFGQSLVTAKKENDLYNETMANNALAAIDMSKYNEKQEKQMTAVATNEFADSFSKSAEQEYANMDKDMKEDWQEKYAEEQGWTIDGDTITLEDGTTMENTEEFWEATYTATRATNDMAKALEQIPGIVKNIKKQIDTKNLPVSSKAIDNLFAAEDGMALSKADVDALKEFDWKAIWEEGLSEEEKKAFNNDYALFEEATKGSVEAGKKALEDSYAKAQNIGFELSEGFLAGQAKGLTDHLGKLYSASGDKGLAEISDSFNELTKDLTDEQLNSFTQQLNSLDWSSIESLESFDEILKDVGINVPEDQLDEFINKLIETGGAVRQIDPKKIEESVKNLGKISKELYQGKATRNFSEEAYEALIKENPQLAGSFQLSLETDEYVYLGESMEALEEAIRENTSALLGKSIEQLQDQISFADIVSNRMDNDDESIGEYEDWDNEVKKGYLRSFSQAARDTNTKILGVEGFTENTNEEQIANMDSSTLNKIFGQIAEIVNAKENNQNVLDKELISSYALGFQGNLATATSTQFSQALIRNQELETAQIRGAFNALGTQAIEAGVDNDLIAEYGKLVAEWKEGEKVSNKLVVAQRKLANAIDYNNMRTGLKNWMEGLQEIEEEYEKLVEGDARGKIQLMNQELSKFGIKVETEEAADEYNELLKQVARGEIDAFEELINESAMAMGAGLGPFETEWNNLTEEQVAFLEEMAALQLGTWEQIGNNTRRFVWASEAELKSLAAEIMDAWENPYDWLYNMNELINSQIREREKLERKFSKTVENSASTMEDMIAVQKEEIASLNERAAAEHAKGSLALAEMQGLANNSDNAKFMKYIGFDASTGQISIDYVGAEAAFGQDAEMGQKFEELVGEFEENRDVFQEAQDSLDEIGDDLKEIRDRGKDEASDIMNGIKEGLITSRQKEIDELSNINESIQDAQSSLVDKMQQQIDEERQARDNQKTEEELQDKRNRLSYLMMDTTGGNQVEIANLQKELKEGEEAYQDSLVDQALADLQKTNEEAARQRQRQIDIAQAQLDLYANSTLIWSDVKMILGASLLQAANGNTFASTSAGQLYLLAQGIAQQNPIEQKALLEQLETNGKLSALYDGVNKINDPLKANTDAISGVDVSVGENTTEVKGAMEAAATKIDTGSLNGYLGNIVGDTKGLKTDVIEKFGDLSIDLGDTERNTAEAENSLNKLADKQGVLGNILSMPDSYFDKLNQMKPASADQWVKQFASIDKNLANLTTQITEQEATYYDTENKRTGSTSFTPSTSPTGGLGSDSRVRQSPVKQINKGSNGFETISSDGKGGYWVETSHSNGKYSSKGGFSGTAGDINERLSETLWEDKAQSGLYFDSITGQTYYYNDNFGTASEFKGDSQDLNYLDWKFRTTDSLSQSEWNNYWSRAIDLVKNYQNYGYDNRQAAWEELQSYKTTQHQGPSWVYTKILSEIGGGNPIMPITFGIGNGSSNRDFTKEHLQAGESENGQIVLPNKHYSVLWITTNAGKKQDAANRFKMAGAQDEQGYISKYGNDWYIYYNGTAETINISANSAGKTLDSLYEEMLSQSYKNGHYRFKTGGLADFTGPAWLDGTPSKPEYILNAAQTARFFELVDVLSSLDGKTQPQETHGDNYFDISIHVDSIEEDYDVDQLAERIKEIIYEDATYRNVNAIHHIR